MTNSECRSVAQQDTTWFHLFHLFYDFFPVYFWFYRLYYSRHCCHRFLLFSILFGSLKFQNQFIEHQLNGRTLESDILFLSFRLSFYIYYHSIWNSVLFDCYSIIIHTIFRNEILSCIFAGTLNLPVSHCWQTITHVFISIFFFVCATFHVVIDLVCALCAVFLYLFIIKLIHLY